MIAGNSTGGYLTPFPTGTTRPATSLNYSGGSTAALGTTIDVNSSGQFSLYVDSSGGPFDVLIDVQGYFDGEPSSSGFTPVTSRVFDSRISPNVTLAASSVTSVQVGGVGAPDGNLNTRATQSTGTSTSWTYDPQDRPTQESDSSGTTNASYDPTGNVLTYVDGGTTTYT